MSLKLAGKRTSVFAQMKKTRRKGKLEPIPSGSKTSKSFSHLFPPNSRRSFVFRRVDDVPIELVSAVPMVSFQQTFRLWLHPDAAEAFLEHLEVGEVVFRAHRLARSLLSCWTNIGSCSLMIKLHIFRSPTLCLFKPGSAAKVYFFYSFLPFTERIDATQLQIADFK